MVAASKESPLPAWGYALAGATGAVLANAAVYPLDIIKTRLQVQVKHRKPPVAVQKTPTEVNEDAFNESRDGPTPSLPFSIIHKPTPADTAPHEIYHGTIDAMHKIIAKEGASGLYAGLVGSLIGVASTNFAYFYWYTFIRTLYIARTMTSGLSTVTELSLGAAAGALAQLFTIPVAVVTTRQQTTPAAERKGLLETGRDVIAADGASGLWRGLKASLVLVVNPAITYGAYQRCKAGIFPNKTNLKPAEAFFLGALSKSLATIATQPLIVAKVGLQSQPPPGVPRFKSFIEVMLYIIEHEGPMSLFKGIGPQILKGVLVQGLLMMTKERMELLFVVFFRYLRKVRDERMAKMQIAWAKR